MRRYLRPIVTTLLLALLIALALPTAWNQAKTGLSRLFFGSPQSLADAPDISLVYTVKRGQWLTFPIPEEISRLRILSNAHIPRLPADPLVSNWKYGVRYQLLKKDNSLLREGVYLHRSNLPLATDTQGKSTFGEFYLQEALWPLSDRSAILAWDDLNEAAYLRIGFETEHPEIEEIAIRAYTPIKISPHRLASEWLRMDSQQQDNLASGSIYPASLLSEFEKQNLMKHQWHPIGPTGIEGRDFEAKTLYAIKNFEPQEQESMLVAAGLQADPEHPGILIIPETGGKLFIDLKTLDGHRPENPVDLTIKGYGDTLTDRWQRRTTWQKTMKNVDLAVTGGLLEITASQPVVISASLEHRQQVEDITPKPLMVKTYRAQQDITFEILHFQQQPAVTRVDIRKIFSQLPTAAPSSVAYEWLDGAQNVVKRGSLQILDSASVYDRLANNYLDRIGDPISYYLTLPPDVTGLRLKAAGPNLLVNAYNQPANFVLTQRIPEDTSLSADRKSLQRSWFPLLATDDHVLFEKQQVTWVAAQPRPPLDDENLLLGLYASRHFIPEGTHETRTILAAVEDTPTRDEMLPNLYCRLPVGVEASLDIKGATDLQTVAPELIFLRNSAAPFAFELDIDHQKILAASSMGRQGTIRLPNLTTGRHRIRLAAPKDGEWLMNYLKGCNSLRYLNRRIFKLNRSGLTFILEHQAGKDENFSGRFFVAAGTHERSDIEISVEGIGVNRALTPELPINWTFTRRNYSIRADNKTKQIVLYSQEQLTEGENFLIPLNSNLPPGNYQVKINLKNGPEGFVGLSRLDPGLHEQHKLNQENVVENR
ncbi:MAG: hypothetical protein LUQ11_13195 [Methylococcaceae bacterium]|nr:hypothetical protein [Methylococcaceae bacterium]